MSLLLDALKKSEAQRRRGKAPAIDLSITSPSGGSRRPGPRWWIALLAVVLLVAAAVGLWPRIADWAGRDQIAAADSGADAADSTETGSSGSMDSADSPASAAPEPAPGAAPTQASATQRASQPAPVAGASNERRIVRADDALDTRTDSAPTAGAQAARPAGTGTELTTRAGPTRPRQPSQQSQPDRAEAAGQADTDGPVDEAADVEQAEVAQETEQTEQTRAAEQADREAARQPRQNFIRPWELPQAQRAGFPELRVTVHFFAEKPADRFVLINGERYAEGQQVKTGVKLVEIRRRGAVVEFGSYRVLIE